MAYTLQQCQEWASTREAREEPPYHDQNKRASSTFAVLHEKWLSERSAIKDPTERAYYRLEAQRHRQQDEEDARREEERRLVEKRLQKEEAYQNEEEEERQRKTFFDEQLRRIASERKKKKEREREEENIKYQELVQWKEAERERRMQEHVKLEQWRQEQRQLTEQASQRVEEARRREESERRERILQVEKSLKMNSKRAMVLPSGWVTMQTPNLLVWKRRYYQVLGSTIYLRRSPGESHPALDSIQLAENVQGLKEWNEGYEELKAIPHSFAIEFKKDGLVWSMYADSEEEKVKLLGLLHHAAGLRG